jgi:hypothetical protein
MVSIFQVPADNAQDVSVNYVSIVKDILKLDNGPMHTPVNLLHCEWIRGHDNRGNLMFVRDEARFLFVNFWHKMPKLASLSFSPVKPHKCSTLMTSRRTAGRLFCAVKQAQEWR